MNLLVARLIAAGARLEGGQQNIYCDHPILPPVSLTEVRKAKIEVPATATLPDAPLPSVGKCHR